MTNSTSEASANAANESKFGTLPDVSHRRARPVKTPLGVQRPRPDTMALDDGERSDSFLAD
jgi:hypothetical protein